MKSRTKRKLSENELMILVFASEFAMCFISIVLGILPLYACMSIGGFFACLYGITENKRDRVLYYLCNQEKLEKCRVSLGVRIKNGNITKRN